MVEQDQAEALRHDSGSLLLAILLHMPIVVSPPTLEDACSTAAILRRLEPTWSLRRSPTLEAALRAGRGTCLDLRPSAAT
jgi:hypothetical protein